MIQTSTQDLLTLHVYGETSLEEREHLAQLLAEDENLQDQLMELVETKRELNSFMKSPSDTSLRIIMEHSRKSEQFQEI